MSKIQSCIESVSRLVRCSILHWVDRRWMAVSVRRAIKGLNRIAFHSHRRHFDGNNNIDYLHLIFPFGIIRILISGRLCALWCAAIRHGGLFRLTASAIVRLSSGKRLWRRLFYCQQRFAFNEWMNEISREESQRSDWQCNSAPPIVELMRSIDARGHTHSNRWCVFGAGRSF